MNLYLLYIYILYLYQIICVLFLCAFAFCFCRCFHHCSHLFSKRHPGSSEFFLFRVLFVTFSGVKTWPLFGSSKGHLEEAGNWRIIPVSKWLITMVSPLVAYTWELLTSWLTFWVVVSNIFIFTPILGEMIQFDEHIFEMGGFYHQAALYPKNPDPALE